MEYSVVFNGIDSCILWSTYQEFVLGNTDVRHRNALVCHENGGPPVMWFTDRDNLLEHAWVTFYGIPVDANGRTGQGWFIFIEGMEKEAVWHWFAKRYRGSIGTLVSRGQEAVARDVPWEL